MMRLENIRLAYCYKKKNSTRDMISRKIVAYFIQSITKTVYVLTGLDGIGVTPEVFLLGWSLDRLSDSF